MKYWPYPKLFAHRGGGVLAPENTLAAMKIARHHGYTAVEFDVKLSADGVAMLMHDDTLDRTTNAKGDFKNFTAQQLEALDAGVWMGRDFVGEKIPRFSAVMHFLHTHGMNADIEIKPCAGRDAETGHQVAMLTEEITRDHVVKPMLSSFSVDALRAARGAAADLPMTLLAEKYQPELDAVLDELQCRAFGCEHNNVNADMLRHLHARDIRVMVYTVNDVARAAALLALGVDGLFTDNLAEMAEYFPV